MAATPLNTADTLSAALALFHKGDYRACAARADQVLARFPANPDALHLRGMAAKGLRDFAFAETCLRNAIRHGDAHPGAFSLHANLGNVLAEQGRLAEAETEYDIATRRAPSEADPWNSWGNALRVAGRLVEAERLLRRAHEAAPRRPDILNNLAAAIQQQGRLNDAADLFHKVLGLDPNMAVAHYNLGCIYGEAQQLEMAVAHHERALALLPDYMDAMTVRLRLAQMMCDWPAVATYAPRLKDLAERLDQPIFPFALLGLPADSAELQKCARRWVEKYYRPYADLAAKQEPHAARSGDRRIRVGYLSSDFHNHATAYLMAEVFELHDRTRFEIIAYSAGPDDGKEMRQRLMKGFDRFVDIRNMSHDAAAALIRDDGIDILVDLKGYTKDTRSAVLAFRPAPIQVNYLGYPGTMGATFVDYIIADEFILPPDQMRFYDEHPAWLPDCYQANDRRRAIAAPPSRAECGLPDDAVVLCCFNHTYKISQPMFATWCRLMQEAPDSVLWLLKSNSWAEDNLRRFAAARGIDTSRIIFAPERPLEQHLARLQNADIFLDTLPYNAHTTCSDALWAGVPVVTYSADTFASRVAGSLLRAVGLDELVTRSIEEYFALAMSLATDGARLRTLKRKLADARTSAPLFDTPRFTRNLENLYAQMWQRHADRLPPAPLKVDANAPSKGAATNELRTPFPSCPLCGEKESVPMGSLNVTKYPIWQAPLPETLNWVRCNSCHHVYTDSYFNERGLEILFSKSHDMQIAQGNWDHLRFLWAPVVERVLECLPESNRLFDGRLSWLDVGCGNGGLVFTAAEFGFHATGLDMREEAVRRIRDMGYRAVQGELASVKVEGPLTVISMADVLEHIPYPLDALKRVHAMLADDGAIFISCPNYDTVSWRGMDRDNENLYWIELEHYHNFSRQSMTRILRQSGFEPVRYSVSMRYKACMEIIALKKK